VASFQKVVDEMTADESGRAGYQDFLAIARFAHIVAGSFS